MQISLRMHKPGMFRSCDVFIQIKNTKQEKKSQEDSWRRPYVFSKWSVFSSVVYISNNCHANYLLQKDWLILSS